MTSLADLAVTIHDSGVAEWLRSTLGAVAILEAIHVMAIATVFGTILVVDLRLLGLPNAARTFTRVSRELLPITWTAFALSAVTGALLFSVNAITYYGNTAFRVKMALLLLAGVNMLLFHKFTFRTVDVWDQAATPPRSARFAGALSLLSWIAVVVVARWIGFTKGYDFTIPEVMDFDFTAVQ
jgi:hypothetical protein